jgi:hypothetical protein
MDLFKRDSPDEFKRYALTDTQIALHWADRAFNLIEGELRVSGMQPTLGACGVKMIEQAFAKVGADLDGFCGCTRGRGGKRNPLNDVAELWSFAANCYHGGLNVAFWVGHSPSGRPVYDHDIRGAYTTAMALLRVPDWSTTRHTTNIDDIAVIDEAMTWCRVQFEFPPGTRFPCLPVRAGNRGLIFPLRGTAWCCGPEIVVARNMGALLTIEAGYRVDWKATPIVRPFEAFAIEINRIRDCAKTSDDTVLNLLAKEVGNSAYGKVAQAVDTFRTVSDDGMSRRPGKRVFDSREERMKTLPPSRITSPMHAATITSLVRALLSEALSRMPDNDTVFTATTDGFLTTLPLGDIDCSGPIAKVFAEARSRLTGDPAIWEQKHAVTGVVVVKTRCTYSHAPIDPTTSGKPVLARGGYRPEQTFATRWNESAFWVDLHRNRDYNKEITYQQLIPLRTQWIEDTDLISLTRTTRVNLDFDWKRRVISPTDVAGVMTGDTEPWETIDQFHAERDALERWKKNEQRVEKTVADLTDRRQWMLLRGGQQASRSTRQSSRPALVNAMLRAIARHQLGAPQWSHQRWASLFTDLGYPSSPQTFKDAVRRGPLKMGKLTELSKIEHAFAAALIRACPSIEIVRLAQPESQAWGLLKTILDDAANTERQANDLEGGPAPELEDLAKVARCISPHSTMPPLDDVSQHSGKSDVPVYEGGTLMETTFKDIQTPLITTPYLPMSLNACSERAPLFESIQERSVSAPPEAFPAVSLPVVCRAAYVTKVRPVTLCARREIVFPIPSARAALAWHSSLGRRPKFPDPQW